MTDDGGPPTDALVQALETIARQDAEIARLRRRMDDERFAGELREAFTLAATTGTVNGHVSHQQLKEMIVETAAQVISANAASLFLIDQAADELVFDVALGEKADEARKFRVPMGHGIAGLVAVTGQALAVSDAEQDPRQASEIADQIGYRPKSLLCVPLFSGTELIGVLELLDKIGAPSFSPSDMEVLGLFANLAAVAIEQSRTHETLGAFVGQAVQSLGGISDERRSELRREAQAFARHMEEEDAAHEQSLEIARLIREIVAQGDDAVRAVQTILGGFAEYCRSGSRIAALGMAS